MKSTGTRAVTAAAVCLLATLLIMPAPVLGQMFDPSLADGPRVSPLPLYYSSSGTFHKNLFSIANSALRLQFLDAFAPAATQPLCIKQEYSSDSQERGLFGIGWSSTLDVRLQALTEKQQLRIFEANGKHTDYDFDRTSQRYEPIVGSFLKSEVTRSGDGTFVREWENGFREAFDARGRRQFIAAGKDKITFSYQGESGQPISVSEALARKFELTYSGGLLAEIKDPVGRKTKYHYHDGRLTETVDSLGRRDTFDYKNGKLAAMKLPRGDKMEFSYTPEGRLSEIAGPGAFKTSFVWRSDTRAPGKELVISYANGTSESIQLAVSSIDEDSWKTAKNEKVPPIDRIGFEFKPTIGAPALLTNKEIYVRSGDALFALDGAGTMRKLGHKVENPPSLAARVSIGISPNEPAWRSRVSPAYIPPGNNHIRYDAVGRPIEFNLDNNKRETWRWDVGDRVVEWKAADGNVTKYSYDDHNHLTEIAVNGETVDTFTYDQSDLLSAFRTKTKEEYTFSYDALGNLIELKNPSGQSRRWKYDANNRISELVSPQSGTWRVEYLQNNLPARISNSRGELRSFEYDSAGDISAVSDETGTRETYTNAGSTVTRRDSSGAEKRVQFDTSGRVTSETYSQGGKRVFSYDSAGRMAKIEDQGSVFTYGYEGGQSRVGIARGQTNSSCRYDAQGRLVEETDTAGNATKYGYSPKGDLKSIELPTGATIRYDYDEQRRLRSITQLLGQQKSTVAYKYDPNGRLVEQTHEDGTTEKFAYDGRGHLVNETARTGNIYRYHYSSDGLVDSVAGPYGERTLKYDGSGRVIESKDPVEGTRSYDYSRATDEVAILDQAGQTRIKANALKQPILVEGALGFKIQQEYDDAGQLIGYADPNGNRSRWKRDSLHRVQEYKTPAGKVYATRYDDNGNPSEVQLPNRTRVSWKYDSANRLTESFAESAGDSVATHWTYQYDKLSRLHSAAGGPGAFTYDYDGLNRITSVQDPFSRSVGLSYDAAGRIDSIRTPEGELFRRHYDSRGLTDWIENGNKRTAFAYDGNARLAQIKYPNGVTVSYEYETAYRIKSISCHDASGKLLYREQYTYDKRGNAQSVADGDDTVRLSYDELCRLVESRAEHGAAERFAYDRAGNITSTADVPVWKYDQDQQLIQKGDEKLEYDGAGDVATADGKQFVWDASRRLQKVILPEHRAVDLAYDPSGKLIEKKTDQSSTHYVYLGNQLLAEYDNQGKCAALYVPGLGGNNWVAVQVEGKEYYPVRSYLGSLVALVDESGHVVKRFKYDSYGRVVRAQGEVKVPPQFAGSTVDQETGLVLMGNRYYSPTLRRFLSPDRFGPGKDGNLYAYAQGNPFRFVDLSGASSQSAYSQYLHDLCMNHGDVRALLGMNYNGMSTSPDPELARIGQNSAHYYNPDSAVISFGKIKDPGAVGETTPILNSNRTNIAVDPEKIAAEAAQRKADPVEFFNDLEGTFAHEARHAKDIQQEVDRLMADGMTPNDAKRAVMERYGNDVDFRQMMERNAIEDQARVNPTLRGAAPGGANEAEIQAAVETKVANYGDKWKPASSRGMQDIADEASRISKAGASEAGYATGSVEEALAVARGSSRAGVVAAEEALPNLASRGARAADAAIEAAAKGLNTAAGVLAKGAKEILPFVGPAIELALAKDEKDVAKALIHAIPGIGEIAMAIDLAHDLGQAMGQAAADLYLATKNKYDQFMNGLGSIAKAIDAMDDPNNPQRPKRRRAVADQVGPSNPLFAELHQPNQGSEASQNSGVGSNSNAQGSGSTAAGNNAGGPGGTGKNIADGGTSGRTGSQLPPPAEEPNSGNNASNAINQGGSGGTTGATNSGNSTQGSGGSGQNAANQTNGGSNTQGGGSSQTAPQSEAGSGTGASGQTHAGQSGQSGAGQSSTQGGNGGGASTAGSSTDSGQNPANPNQTNGASNTQGGGSSQAAPQSDAGSGTGTSGQTNAGRSGQSGAGQSSTQGGNAGGASTAGSSTGAGNSNTTSNSSGATQGSSGQNTQANSSQGASQSGTSNTSASSGPSTTGSQAQPKLPVGAGAAGNTSGQGSRANASSSNASSGSSGSTAQPPSPPPKKLGPAEGPSTVTSGHPMAPATPTPVLVAKSAGSTGGMAGAVEKINKRMEDQDEEAEPSPSPGQSPTPTVTPRSPPRPANEPGSPSSQPPTSPRPADDSGSPTQKPNEPTTESPPNAPETPQPPPSSDSNTTPTPEDGLPPPSIAPRTPAPETPTPEPEVSTPVPPTTPPPTPPPPPTVTPPQPPTPPRTYSPSSPETPPNIVPKNGPTPSSSGKGLWDLAIDALDWLNRKISGGK